MFDPFAILLLCVVVLLDGPHRWLHDLFTSQFERVICHPVTKLLYFVCGHRVLEVQVNNIGSTVVIFSRVTLDANILDRVCGVLCRDAKHSYVVETLLVAAAE